MSDLRISRNRRGVINNSYQGNHKKVLTVCSAGCLRSPTAAHILSADPFNFNTRAAGISKEYAIIPVDAGLIIWADVIVCMDEDHAEYVNNMQLKIEQTDDGMFEYVWKPIYILDIPDDFAYRDPVLVDIMTKKFFEIFKKDLEIPNV